MGLQVLLHDNRRPEDVVFRPGDTIYGKVIYKLTKPKTIDRAIVELKGTVKTEYIPLQTGNTQIVSGPRRPSKDKLRLFEREVVLFQGPYKVPAQTFEWPFEFSIPKTCSRDTTQTEPMSLSIPGVPHDAEIDLPPSYKWRDMAIGRDASCEIVYMLSVAVESGGRLENLVSGESHELPLVIRSNLPPSPQSIDLKPTAYNMTPIKWSSGQLRPAERRLSFKDRLKSNFSSDPALKSPCLAFQTIVHLPRLLDIHQRFAIGFSIQYERNTDSPNDPESPTLELAGITLTLHNKTTVIFGKGKYLTPERNASGGLPMAKYKAQLPDALNLPLDGELVFTTEKFCLAEWLGQKVVDDPQILLSDFSMWVIRLAHQLGIDIVVRHVETEKEFKISALVPLQLQHSIATVEQSGEGSSRNDQEHLPRYEAETKPPPDVFGQQVNG